jgi:hypothetical protein
MKRKDLKRIKNEKIYLDYPYEESMIRTEPDPRRYFLKFYGKEEFECDTTHPMFNEVLICGFEITKDKYEKGKKIK